MKLKEYRELFGKTQAEIAMLLNVDRVTYTNYENEKRSIKTEILIKLAEFYNVSVDSLLGINTSNTLKEPELLPSKAEIELIKKYRQLDADGKKRISYALNLEYQMAAKPDEQNNSIKKKVM